MKVIALSEVNKMSGMVQLFYWGEKDSLLDCQYGKVTVKEWLRREYARIKRDKSRKVEMVSDRGYLTLFVDNNIKK